MTKIDIRIMKLLKNVYLARTEINLIFLLVVLNVLLYENERR